MRPHTSDLGLIGQINILDYNVLKKFLTDNGGTVGTIPRPVAAPHTGKPAVQEITVYGIDGKQLVAKEQMARAVKLPITRSGVYFLKIQNGDGSVTLVKRLAIKGLISK
jgi:hypothetical protein